MYIVTSAAVDVSPIDVQVVGTGRGNGVVLADSNVFALHGVSSADAVVVMGAFGSGTEPSGSLATQYILAITNRYGNASGPSMWSVPGLCQYLVEDHAECEAEAS